MITFRAVALQDGTNIYTAKMWFDLPRGFFEPAEVRGQDHVIPGKSGREVRGRIKDHRRPELFGWVRGEGDTEQERSEDWYTTTQALMAVMDYSLSPGALVLSDGYLGLPTGDTATLQARAVNAIPGPVERCMSFQRWTFALEAVGSPPDWTIA